MVWWLTGGFGVKMLKLYLCPFSSEYILSATNTSPQGVMKRRLSDSRHKREFFNSEKFLTHSRKCLKRNFAIFPLLVPS